MHIVCALLEEEPEGYFFLTVAGYRTHMGLSDYEEDDYCVGASLLSVNEFKREEISCNR